MIIFSRKEELLSLSRQLVGWFICSIVLIVLLINASIYYALSWSSDINTHDATTKTIITVTLIVIGTIISGSIFKWIQLKRGGISIGFELNGKIIEPSDANPSEKVLLNIIDEMSIASRLPRPEVFVLENDLSINAFAAGLTPSDSVIGVTQGALEHLTRDELQAVIAHEMGHIAMRDVALASRILAVISGLGALSLVGRSLLSLKPKRWGKKSGKGLAPLMLLGTLLWIAGSLGIFFGRLIQSKISKKREFLADLSSVQFTRNPKALASALMKIGGLREPWINQNRVSYEYSHFFFSSPFTKALQWFDSHPPLIDRIKAIDPTFDGKFKEIEMPVKQINDPLPKEYNHETSYFDAQYCAAFLIAFAEKKNNISTPTNQESPLRKARHDIQALSDSSAITTIYRNLPSLKKLSLSQRNQLIQHISKICESQPGFSLSEFTLLKMLREVQPIHQKFMPSILSIKAIQREIEVILTLFLNATEYSDQDKKNLWEEISHEFNLESYSSRPRNLSSSDLDQAIDRISQAHNGVKRRLLTMLERIVLHDKKVTDPESVLLSLMSYCLEIPVSTEKISISMKRPA